jgi:hypothetical protein
MALSVPEVIKLLIASDTFITNLAAGGVVVAPAEADDIANYVVIVAEKAWIKSELYAPIVKPRIQIWVEGPELDIVEQIKDRIVFRFHYDLQASKGVEITQSNDETYRVCTTWLVSGPVYRGANEIHTYQEESMVLGSIIGTQPLNVVELE